MNNIIMLTRTTLLALVMSLASATHAKLNVVATTTDLAWLAREVGAERVKVHSITRGYQDPHFVEPKPSYIVKLSRADIVLYVGRELEVGWLPKLLDGSRNPNIQAGQRGHFSGADLVSNLELPTGAVDRTHGDVHPLGNPHYWLQPPNMVILARALASRFGELDPEGAERYQARAEQLTQKINRYDTDWKQRLSAAHGLKLVAYHKTFSYFFAHYGLRSVGFVEPKPGVPPSSRHLAGLINKIKSDKVAFLLVENFFDPRNAEFVAERTGIPLVIAPVSVGGEKHVSDWFKLMEFLVSSVEKAATG